jgi:hypothetical protein
LNRVKQTRRGEHEIAGQAREFAAR